MEKSGGEMISNLKKDPICGMMVDEKKTTLKSEFAGQTFYFCAPGCKKKFDVDPSKYAHQKK